MHRRIQNPAIPRLRPTQPWRIAIYALLLPILATIAVATAASAQSPTFRDPDNDVSLTIPDGWTVATASRAGAIVSLVAPTARGTFDLFAEAVPADTTLDRYASDMAVRPERGPEGAVALHGGIAYTLTFATAPDEKETYFAQARTLLDTFTFLAASE